MWSRVRNVEISLILSDAVWVDKNGRRADDDPFPACDGSSYSSYDVNTPSNCYGHFDKRVRVDNLPLAPGPLFDTNDHYYSTWKEHDSLKGGVNIIRTSCVYPSFHSSASHGYQNDCRVGYMSTINGSGLGGKPYAVYTPPALQSWEKSRDKGVSIANTRIVIPEDWKTKYPQGFSKIQIKLSVGTRTNCLGSTFKHIDLRGEAI